MSEQEQIVGGDVLKSLLVQINEKLSNAEAAELFVENIVQAYTIPPRERYSNDFFFDIVKPMLSSLIRLKDDTAKELRYFKDFLAEKSCENEGTDYANDILASLIGGIDDILFDYDVQPFISEDNRFNPRRQNVIKKIITDDPALVKTVAESLGCGYERNGAVITKERIAAYAEAANK